MTPSLLRPPDLADQVAQGTRRWRGRLRERPFRFLLDSRIFRLLCDPGQTAALESFRAALAHLRLAPAGGLPDLEMTPLAILDAIGVEPPRLTYLRYFPKGMATLEDIEVGVVIKEMIQKDFAEEPELAPEKLMWRVEALRDATDPAAHELFDLCLTRYLCREKFEESLVEQLTYDALITYRYPEEYRERMAHLFDSFLLSNMSCVPGLSRVRRLKNFWDKSLERILKKNLKARTEILAADQEVRPRTYKDFLEWEVVHHAVMGYPLKRMHPVVAFAPEPGDRLRARCRAHKMALRAFLDEIDPEELAGNALQQWMGAWSPGWLVPCREDGTLEEPISTAEEPVWAAGPSPASVP